MWGLLWLWMCLAQAFEMEKPVPVLEDALGLMQAQDPDGPAALGNAISTLVAAAQQNPTSADAQYQAGVALYYGRREDLAQSAFERTITIDEDHLSARYWLASIASDLGKHEESVQRWADLAERAPDFYIARSNQGQSLQLLGRNEEALAVFRAIATDYPMDWRSHAKVVQLSQAVGDTAGRDKARQTLLDLRASKQVAELNQAKVFIRDQFLVPGSTDRVLVAEHFERIDPQALIYQFYRQDEQGNNKGVISLGSYALTNSAARASGEIGPDESIYHLDSYPGDNSHFTYAFYKTIPPYDELRAVVLEIYAGKRQPSGSTVERTVPPTDQAESLNGKSKRTKKKKKKK